MPDAKTVKRARLSSPRGRAAFTCRSALAVVVMPGIRSLDDGSFIRAFQAIDRVIQTSSRCSMLVWVGSVLAMGASVASIVLMLLLMRA